MANTLAYYDKATISSVKGGATTLRITTLSITTFSTMILNIRRTYDPQPKWHSALATLNITMLCHYADCHYAKGHVVFIAMLNVEMLCHYAACLYAECRST